MTELEAADAIPSDRRLLAQVGHTLVTKVVLGAGRLILLLLFARALAPEDLGAYSLITTTIVFGLVFLGLNTSSYLYRAVPGAQVNDAWRILTSVALFELSVAVPIMAIVSLSGLGDQLLSLLGVTVYRTAFIIGGGWLGAELVCQQVLNYLYARQRIEQANLVDLIKQVGWIPVVLAGWTLGWTLNVETLVTSALLAASLAALIGLVSTEWRPRAPTLAVIQRALRFAVPLIIPALAFTSMKLADRYVLSATRSLAETGLYSLAGSLTNLSYSLTALVIANTMTPTAVRAHNEGHAGERDRALWKILKYSLWLFVLASVLLMIGVPALLNALARSQYLGAMNVFPLIALGYGLVVIAGPAHNLLWLADRTRAIMLIDLTSMLLVLTLDLILIPGLGGYGAAFATILGFGAGAIAKYVVSGLWRTVPLRELFSVRTEILGLSRLFQLGRRSGR